ncbi:MAG: PAS domain-containing protein [Aliarcobacter sp.]|uniref:PAS sensor-containing signal transduction protein n=1 Tax=Arcobacter aquimarinus TaxID=1315211 RepID=A0AAE7B3R6_9BACT|nr:PAS domain-containing protein [Arcobacter aquimarinus]MCB9096378.1 PAS domain-containing protein [Arcobacter sp.]QKE25174.1 PAS sensor-containing signal transduction protein [Arcobacter aquimarinus]RXI36378.1 chemotaxis protein [Arcobacter aquimarinus]
MEFLSGNFLCETIVPSGELIVSRTDLKGNITYANDTFALISGYKMGELIGRPHNMVRHPDMPKIIFSKLWEDLKTKGSWSGVVKNLRKDEGFYWVYAEISGVYKNNELIEYKSIRTPISFEDKVKYQLYYDQLKKQNNEPIRKIIYN